LLLASACSYEHASNVLVPSAITGGSTTSRTTSSASYVGTWTSQSLVAPSPSSCSNFQWKVANQTSTSIAGTFEADCAGGVTVTGSGSGQLISSASVALNIVGVANIPGAPTCNFSLNGNGTVEDNGNALRIPYTGTTCVGPVHGTEVL